MMLVASFFILLAVILFLGEVAKKPIQLLWKLLLNSALGFILLALFNYTAAVLDWNILPINLLTILISGFLGVPGVILLLLFQVLLGNA